MEDTLRNQSAAEWNSEITINSINAGSLQRIADAAEKMATNYVDLQNELSRYKKMYAQRGEALWARDKTISTLRGQITKLKNKLKP